MRRRFAVLAGVLVAALVAAGVLLTQRTDQVAALDQNPVTHDELLFHMRRLAPQVQNELRNQYHLTGAIDWNAKAGDRTAIQRLSARALDEIWRDKTTLLLAQEEGLVTAADHASFLAELDGENERRADAGARGEVVYGLKEFTPEQYYSHRLTELSTVLKQRLSEQADGPLRVTDAEVRQAFDADREAWSANATTYTYAKLVVPVPDDASTGYADGLQRRVTEAGRLKKVTEPGATLTTGTYDGGASVAHQQDLMAVLGPLKSGQISAPVPGTGQITYYELNGRTVDEDKAFTEYARRIRLSLIEQKFTQFIQRRVGDSDITIDPAAVDAINAEDVGH